MNISSSSPFDRLLSIAAIIISIIALVIAWQANNLLQEQNQLVKEANIAANLADIRFTSTDYFSRPEMVNPFPCTNYSANRTYSVIFNTASWVTFSNVGGRSVSLVDVNLTGVAEYWGVQISLQPGSEEPLTLPVDLPAGSSRSWFFDARGRTTFDTEFEAVDLIRILDEYTNNGPSLQWSFLFGDGTVLTRYTFNLVFH